MAAKTKPAPETVTVTAQAALCEAGVQYKKGDTFTTTPDRAESLGDLVTPTPEAAG